MPRLRLITALDIGTSSIKIISAFKQAEKEIFEIAAQAQASSFGIRKGVVIDVSKVEETISSLTEKVEQESGRKIESVYASIEGSHIFCTGSHGLVSVSRADQKISEEDVERVIQAAKTLPLPSNKEIIDIFPKEFVVDGEKGVKEPVGMQGVRLEAEALVVCCFSPYLKNSTQAILNSGFQINDLVPAPLASAWAVLTPREKELGVVLLDIGAGTSGMSVFEEGGLIHLAIFPVGSAHITNDIAVCLKTDIDTAERIKLEFGSCKNPPFTVKKAAKNNKKIKTEENEELIFSSKTLIDIIEARVREIFNLASKELKKISRQGLLPAGVVLTGGGAKLPGIKDLAKKELKLPCRIGFPKEFPSLQDDSAFSAVCGLVKHGYNIEVGEGRGAAFKGSFGNKIKNLFKFFIP